MLPAQAGGLGGEPGTELGRMDDRGPTHERLHVEVRITDQMSRQCPEPSARSRALLVRAVVHGTSRPSSRWSARAGGHDLDLVAVAQQLPRDAAHRCSRGARAGRRRAAVWSRLLPFLVVVLAPSGSRERGRDPAARPSSRSRRQRRQGWRRRRRRSVRRATDTRPRLRAPASATFHTARRLGAPAGFVRCRAIQRNVASAVSAATATQAAPLAPPDGTNTSPRTMTRTSARPLATAIARCALPAIRPSCHVWTRKTGSSASAWIRNTGTAPRYSSPPMRRIPGSARMTMPTTSSAATSSEASVML